MSSLGVRRLDAALLVFVATLRAIFGHPLSLIVLPQELDSRAQKSGVGPSHSKSLPLSLQVRLMEQSRVFGLGINSDPLPSLCLHDRVPHRHVPLPCIRVSGKTGTLPAQRVT